MANISAYLKNIQDAVYGEEVRGSIHDAIELINLVAERTLDAGTAINSATDPITGYYEGSLYLNTSTDDLWECTGTSWILRTNLKGVGISSISKTATAALTDTYTILFADGSFTTFDVNNGKGIVSIIKTGSLDLVDTYTITYNDGTTDTIDITNGYNGNRWYRGVDIKGKATNPTVYASSGIAYAYPNDYYLNYAEGSIYYCVREGDANHSEWVYDFDMSGGGGISTWSDLLNKPFTFVGTKSGLEVIGTDSTNYTLQVKTDGSYISIDTNGAITLNSSLLASLNILKPVAANAGKVLKTNASGTALEWSEDNDSKDIISDAYSPSRQYEVGSYAIYDSKLWKKIGAKEQGITPTEGTSWTEVTISSEISSFANKYVGTSVGKNPITLPSIFKKIIVTVYVPIVSTSVSVTYCFEISKTAIDESPYDAIILTQGFARPGGTAGMAQMRLTRSTNIIEPLTIEHVGTDYTTTAKFVIEYV